MYCTHRQEEVYLRRNGFKSLRILEAFFSENSKNIHFDKFSKLVYKDYLTYYNNEYKPIDEQYSIIYSKSSRKVRSY